MHQDTQGFIWVGTESGLYRFDGIHFTEFGVESGLPSRFIVGLGQDESGRLWVATHEGLAYRIHDEKFQVVTYKGRPIKFRGIPLLSVSNSGGVIVGTSDGLQTVSLSGGAPLWHFLMPPHYSISTEPRFLKSVLASRDGSVFFGCGDQICQLENGSIRVWGVEQGVPKAAWVRLLERRNGEVWARTEKYIVRLRAGASRFQDVSLPSLSTYARSSVIVEDATGRVLAGLDGAVARFENEKWSIAGERNGFVDSAVTSLIIDRENQPWLGFAGHGIAKWLGYDRWEAWTKRQGLGSNDVWSVLRDSRDRLWVGNRSGVDVLDPGSSSFRRWIHSPLRSMVAGMAETKDGFVWLITFSGLVIQIDVRTQDVVSQTMLDAFDGVLVDSGDRLWIATDKGLFVGEGSGLDRKFKTVLELGGYGAVDGIKQAPNGDLWAVSDTGLFWHPHSQTQHSNDTSTSRWQRVDISKTGLKKDLYALAFDRDGWLWIESLSVGVARLKIDEGRVNAVERIQLQSKQIISMNADARGWIWLGEDDGIEVFDGSSRHLFNIDNGLIWNDCNSKAFALDRDGSVWLGTSGGIAHYVSSGLPIGIPAKPILVDVRYGAKQLLKPSARVRLQPDSLIFTIAPMNFGGRQHLFYRYRMTGLEDTWNETQIPEVRYPKLSPRNYRFEVASLDSISGRISPLETMQIDITAPWYLTRTFDVGGFLVAAYVAVLLWQWRVRTLVARQRELEILVLERTEELNRRLEQKKILQAEAERANHAKSSFLAMMSHEIRTPMNGVIGMTTLLDTTELSDVQAEYVKTIRESGTSLLCIINDILDFSKIEADKLTLETTEFRLIDCIDEPLAVIRDTARRKGVNLVTRAAPNLPSRLVGDPVRIKQVVLNLVSNAIKFTEQGSVEVNVYAREKLSAKTAQIVIEVKDTGIGISPENQKQLFQSFTQAETSTTRNYGGTGLGLVICKRLVEMMDGSIGVDSDPGRGSLFRVAINLQLPTAQKEENPLPESAAKQAPEPLLEKYSAKKILVAEDNLINQKVALRMLSMLGYSGDVAENGADALGMLEKVHYDAVLMDMHMPVMDGLEATRAIRRLDGALSRIPIIAVTANAIQGERQKCLAAGMNDFITKPIDKEKFRAALEQWTAGATEN